MAPAPVLTRTLKRARLAASVTSLDELRLRALSLIQITVASDRAGTRLAQQVGEGHAGPTPLGPSLRNSFGGKATATIYRRAQSLWGFFSWIRIDKNRDLVLPFPSTKNGIKMSFFWMLHPQIFRQPQVDRG